MKYPKYEKYKDSGIDWLGSIPSHWKISKLKYLGQSIIGITYTPEDVVDKSENGTLVLRASNIQNNRLSFKDCVYVNMIVPKKLKTQFGDVLICSRNGSRNLIGKNVLISEEVVGETFGAFMTIYRSSYWKYLSKVFQSEIFTSQSDLYLTTTINQLTIGTLNNLVVPLPLDEFEQQSIANFLDKETTRLDSLISKKQQLIETLKEKRIAIISHAVTKGLKPDVPMKDSGIEWLGDVPRHWEVKKLKYNVTKVGSGVTPEGGATIYEDEGIPLIRSQNVYSNGLRLDDVVYISGEIHNNMNNSKVKKGDVLLNITGASLGRCYYMDDAFTEANVNQHVCIIRPIAKKLATKYLHLLLISEAGQEQIWNNQTGSGREGLNFVSIKNFSFAYPPTVEEQEEIIDNVLQKTIKIDLLLAKTEQALNKLQEYKTALISAAVTGKIKVPEQA